MAKEQARQFVMQISEDQELQHKLAALKDGEAGLINMGQDCGFDFTVDEMRSVIAEQQKRDSGELSDEALELVSAGASKRDDPPHVVVIAIIAILIG